MGHPIVCVEEMLYAFALAADHRYGFCQIFAVVFFRMFFHIGGDGNDWRYGIAHFMGHDTQYSVVVQFAGLKLARIRAI